jgi:hypothetical protein
MKNLLIGVFSNYTWDNVAPWVNSAKKNIKDCDVVLIALNSDFDTIDKITEKEVNVVICNADDEKRIVYNHSNFAPHVERFIHLYNYLKEVKDEYKFIITTDVRDVVFENDPFEYLENNLGDKKLVCGSECLKYSDEPWGNDNLFQTYGKYIHNRFKENEIFNVGILGGYSDYMTDICLNLFLNSINRPISIVDQAVFNVTVNTKPYSDIFKFCRLTDAFSVNAGTTNDPNKYADFKPKLLEQEAKLVDGFVCNSEGTPFVVVHQYDRVPEWNEIIMNKYGA